ncbi:MAG: hypothetical protein RL417_2002 [Pseudomonadota bacterium]|jgi:UPF0176 protein
MFQIAAFYKFVPLAEGRVGELKALFERAARSGEVVGLVLLGSEGCNATVAAPSKLALEDFLAVVRGNSEFADAEAKLSESAQRPFRRFKVDVRSELITLKKTTVLPPADSYLSPMEWHDWLSGNGDGSPVVLDVRNGYETALGVFREAVTLPLEKFSQLPEAVRQAGLPKDKPILMYCTGGIRCEKAIEELRGQGYGKLYQLQGGILKYLEEYPEGHFEGECFVFDHRVAVDSRLQPSTRYSLCPHCGDPGEQRISCLECGRGAVICDRCLGATTKRTCSKNCSYHQRRRTSRSSELERNEVRHRKGSKTSSPREV